MATFVASSLNWKLFVCKSFSRTLEASLIKSWEAEMNDNKDTRDTITHTMALSLKARRKKKKRKVPTQPQKRSMQGISVFHKSLVFSAYVTEFSIREASGS